MRCPNCSTMNSPGARFCQNCGATLAGLCRECSASNRPEARFCQNCGAPLALAKPAIESKSSLPPPAPEAVAAQRSPSAPAPRPAYERRLVTILFVDVIGYSSLSEKLDPEEVMEIMRGAYPCLMEPIERNDGTIVQVMGDGILAFFGAPRAHVDDPERAIRAGLEIQRRIQEYAGRLQRERAIPSFNVRVGIHSGLVVVGEIRPDKHLEYTALGDAVNLAARLQQNAPPGGVLVSHETFRHVLGLFNAQTQSPLTVKGRQQSVQTYLVTGVKPRAWRIHSYAVAGVSTRMVGRRNEMEQLKSCYQQAVEAGRSTLLLISGDPGVGKSRLLNEFITWADLQTTPIRYFRGLATPSSRSTSYALFRDLFAYRFEILESDTPGQALDKFRKGAANILPPEQADLVGQLVGFDFAESPAVASLLGGQSFAQLASIYLVSYFRQLADEPLLIVLEDLQEADDSSLELILRLIAEIAQGRSHLLMVCAARPQLFERHPEWGSGISGVQSLPLKPLTRPASRRLVDEIFKKAERLPESLAERIVAETEGNPLFIEELIKMLIEDGVVEAGDECWEVNSERLAGLRVPPTLAGILQARLDSLAPAERLALQRAAVIGPVFWDRLVSQLSADLAEAAQVRSSLAGLVSRELIYLHERSTIAGAEEYIFKHSLLQEAAYETVLIKERRRYHFLVAEWIAEHSGERQEEYQALIADHYAQCDQPSLAIDWYLRAGAYAFARGAAREAVRLNSRALELLPADDLPRRWQALLGRDEAYGQLGDLQARRQDDEALLALATQTGDPRHLSEAYYRLGSQLHREGDSPACQRAFDQALDYAYRGEDLRMVAMILPMKIFDLVRSGNLEAASPLIEPALQATADYGDEEVHSRALMNISAYYTANGDLARSAQLLQQASEINLRIGNLRGETIAQVNLAYNYLLLGLYPQTLQTLERALTTSRQIEARATSAYILINRAMALLRLERSSEAEDSLAQSRQLFELLGDQMGLAYHQLYLGMLNEARGELEAAQACYQTAHGEFHRLEARPLSAEAHASLAYLHLLQGHPEPAREAAAQAAAYLEQHGPAGLEFPIRAYLNCARVLAAAGEQAASERILQTARRELEDRAARLSDADWRRTFLEAVPENRELLELATQGATER